MRYDEADIDFSVLDPAAFEELCFDLLARLGFQELTWRRAAADSGRDIEGKWTVQLPVVGASRETWAVECKHYSRGVPPDALSSKLSWAEAERPSRLLILVSSHLTNGARDWLLKREKQLAFRVHVIEGKLLRQQLLAYDELVERYFGSRYSHLLRQSVQSWALHGLIPSLETLRLLLDQLDHSKLTVGELGFLWCARTLRQSEIDEWQESNEDTFPGAGLLSSLSTLGTTTTSVLDPYETLAFNGTIQSSTSYPLDEASGEYTFVAEMLVERGHGASVALYGYHAAENGAGCELVVVSGMRPEGVVVTYTTMPTLHSAKRKPWHRLAARHHDGGT
jgi:hypothetical protein